jgi:uracil-DNA glycosylase
VVVSPDGAPSQAQVETALRTLMALAALCQQPVLVTVPLGHVVAFHVTPEKSVK